ncbi:MAG: sulfur carrier protein ThiS [Cohaesibacter sp.]|nr:sulfur carrier protein ThiS [Cohaesibacter sp.]MCV6603501.1 sulfur carrier protein ThiS [Cohaesibacter sp.]
MKLIVNGEATESRATSLSELLNELGFEGDWLATAVDSELVVEQDRAAFCLKDGQRIEILSPMQGG